MRRLGRKAVSLAMAIVLALGMCPGLAMAEPAGDAPVAEKTLSVGGLNTQMELETQGASSYGYTWPLRAAGKQTDSFRGSNHKGVDIAVPAGNDVLAAADGYVKYVQAWDGTYSGKGWMMTYGNLVIIYHPSKGTATYYAHLQNYNVSLGQQVKQGQVIGHVGKTGKSSGPHLHFELRLNAKSGNNTYGGSDGTYVNPLNYVSSSNIYTAQAPTPTAKTPTIIPHDMLGGKKVEIKNNESGASVRYTLDGKTNPSNSVGTVYYSDQIIDDWATMGVRAIAYKSGMNNSSIAYYTVYNNTTATPTLEKTDMSSGAVIALDAAGSGETIYYTTDGSDPSFDIKTGAARGTKYTAAFTLTSNCTVKAIAVRSGELVSGKLVQSIEVVPPAAPTGLATFNASKPAAKIAVDDAITVKWMEDKKAASYIATLYNASGDAIETANVKAAQAVFTPSVAGKYSVVVKAVNSVGESEESEPVEFEAMAPCLVRFVDKQVDDEGVTTVKVLDKQLVRYGYSAETPAVPTKRGYTFAGWDKDTPLTNITEPTYDIVANWQINTYTIRFYKQDGKTLIASQSVEYGKAATPPTPPAADPGYVFSGWTVTEADEGSDRDYANVDSPMKLKAVYAWADQELPVVVSITNAKRNERVYTVDVNVTNNPMNATTAWLRVSLKTSAGKLVQSAKETISLPAAGATKNHTVTLKYDEGGFIATKAEVEVVGYSGDNRTGGAYSKAVTATVVAEDDYVLAADASEWSTEKPAESSNYVIESEVQYRYKDRQTTTSTASELDGWTRDGSSNTSYGSWGGNQSTTSKPTASDTLTVTGQSTKYNYYHWHSRYDGIMNQDSCWVNNTSEKHTLSTTNPLSGPKYVFADKGGKASQEYGPSDAKCSWNPSKAYWWLESTVTTYTYQTRSKTVSYGYYRWSDWSDWSNEEVVETDSRNVETRTVYRTRAKEFSDLTGTEDTAGESYTISGKFGNDMDVAGKEATIMVYNVTNSDPNEDQIQYIGQTTIGADNSYSFSFIPKKAPSAETGDFIVALGVKGSTGLVNVDKIDAPANEHTVIYMYKDAGGQEVTVSEQSVADGASAEVPDPPAVEGAQFQRWSASTTNVTGDMTVTALYSTATYAVAWVDWVNGGVFLETKAYGDELAAPVEDPSANGYTFKGWDALVDGKTTVTGNMVVNAVYEPVKYSVVFADAAGGVFSKQEVAYGEAANPPAEGPEADGMVFVSWDTSAGTPWWNVTEDMIVRPKYAYEETVSSPQPTVEIDEGFTGIFGKKLMMESATEGATIFYKIDKKGLGTQGALSLSGQGSDEAVEQPEEEWFEYDPDKGVTIMEPCTITAVAAMAGMNDSTPTTLDVNVTATNDIAKAEAGVAEASFFYGEPVEPGVMVWFGDELLTYGEDYTVEYSDNTALGTGKALVKGAGSYTGQQVIEFEIVLPPEDGEGDEPSDATSLADATVSVASQSYTGNAVAPAVTVKLDSNTLVVNTDYTVTYSNNVNAGTGIVTITGKGSYSGTKTATFKIAPVSIDGKALELSKKSFTYNGKVQKPVVSTVGGKKLEAGVDYALSYSNASSKVPGTYSVQVVGSGNYEGVSASASYAIAKAANPLKAKAVGKTAKLAKGKKKLTKKTVVKGAIKITKKGQGKVTYARIAKGSSKKLTVAKKTGKITVKKGTKKGAYKIKVRVTAAGNANYKAGSKTVTCKVRVK